MPRPNHGFSEICYVRLTKENSKRVDRIVTELKKMDEHYSKSKLLNELIEEQSARAHTARLPRKKKKVA